MRAALAQERHAQLPCPYLFNFNGWPPNGIQPDVIPCEPGKKMHFLEEGYMSKLPYHQQVLRF